MCAQSHQVRTLHIDEAITQCKLVPHKAAKFVVEVRISESDTVGGFIVCLDLAACGMYESSMLPVAGSS